MRREADSLRVQSTQFKKALEDLKVNREEKRSEEID